MPRYYFHVCGGDKVIEDLEGIDLPNIAAVQEEALQAAREIVAELVIQGDRINERRFLVVDENGDTVLIMPFTSAISR
jgi:hypothetical protein